MEIKSYCINLKRATERKISFEKNWRPILGENLEYFEAIDGRFLEDTSCLTSRQLACVKSHIALMKFALKTKQKYFLVFEDDAIPLYQNVLEVIGFIYKKTKSDIIHCCIRDRYAKQIQQENGKTAEQLHVIVGIPREIRHGACMMFYTRSGMKQYINKFETEKFPADWYHLLDTANSSMVIPPLVDHKDIDSFISTNHGRTFIP